MSGTTIQIHVDGMTCGHCEASVVGALEALPGVTSASADRGTGTATFQSDGQSGAEAAVSAVLAIGFDARP